MKHTITAVAIMAASVAGSAHANDWSGAYFGAHVATTKLSGGMDAHTPWNGFAGFDLQGVTGSRAGLGLHAGYNFQMDNLVTGIEFDVTHVGLKRETTTGNLRPDFPRFERSLNTTASIAPRIGFAQDNFLVYGKVGLAMGRFGSAHDQQGTTISGSKTRYGWLAGVGVEYRATPSVAVRAGVDYMDFGSFRTDIAGSGGNPDIYTRQRARTTRASLGMTWYFN